MKCLKKIFFQDFQKLAGLWLVGEMDNHVGIYGSKVAEGFSAFQRRSCCILLFTVELLIQSSQHNNVVLLKAVPAVYVVRPTI